MDCEKVAKALIDLGTELSSSSRYQASKALDELAYALVACTSVDERRRVEYYMRQYTKEIAGTMKGILLER